MSGQVVGLSLNAVLPDRIEFQHSGKSVAVLGSTAKFVLVVMAAASQDDGKSACLSVNTIQAQTGYSRPTVITAMRSLQTLGIIQPTGKHPIYRTIIYDINMDKLAELNSPILTESPDISKATLPIAPEIGKVEGKAALPIDTEIGKATLPITPEKQEIGKVEGKAALPYQLTINTIQEEEEEEKTSSSFSSSEPANVAPNAGIRPALQGGVSDVSIHGIPAGVGRPEIYSVYEQNIGVLTPIIAESLTDAVNTHGLTWVSAAIREAVQSGARNWRYINAILQRWQTQGYGTDSRRPTNQKTKSASAPSPKSSGDNRIRTDADFQRAAEAFLKGGA